MIISAMNVNAHDFEVQNDDGVTIYYKITSSTDLTVAVTFRGNNPTLYTNRYTGGVILPETVHYSEESYSVTSIDGHAFEFCTELTSVELPNSITIIDSWAFRGCSALTSIEIPQSVTKIASNAFSGCSNITQVTLNSNAIVSKTYTSDSNFSSIFGNQVEKYILGEGITTIGSYAFSSCAVSFPDLG